MTSHSYFVVMLDLGRSGLEAVVQPEITRNEVISRLRTREYKNVVFIHFICDGTVTDVTEELFETAEALAWAERRAPLAEVEGV